MNDPRGDRVPGAGGVPPARRALFAILAVALGLVVVEGAALLVERALPAAAPPPSPGTDPSFNARAEAARRGLPPLPDARGARAAPGGAPTPLMPDARNGWALEPGKPVPTGPFLAHINALGLRGPDLGPRAADELRLFTLGDSTVFGDAIADGQVFDTVAARRLEAALGRPVTSVNGGVPGYATGQARERLARFGALVQPTHVVIATLWSDLYAAAPKGGAPSAIAGNARAGFRRLATWRVGRRLLAPWLPAGRVGWIDAMDRVGQEHLPPRTDLAHYALNLEAMGREARALGAEPVFLALPAPIDLEGGAPPAVNAYRDAMLAVATSAGATYVDGPAYFRAHGGTVGHFLDQVHPDPHGHALLGEALAEGILAVIR